MLLAISFLAVQCVDRDFDTPPLDGEDPNIDASQIVTIKEINDLRIPGNFVPIAMDKYLSVVVAADDQSGNFYKSLVVQDETGGMTIILDDVELWNRFFVGKRLFIYLNDLWISDYNGLPQIGFEPYTDASGNESLARVPSVIINDIILSGTSNNPVESQVVSISELGESHLNSLVTIEGLQLNQNAVGSTFADAVNLISVNHTLENCSNQRIILRTSGFADFASQEVPSGNGSITGIYGVFGSDKQLTMRDGEDINFDGMRCGTVEIEIDESKVITVAEMLDRWVPGVEVPLNMDNYIKGSVISDDRAGNFFKSLVIQDATGGIAVLVDAFDLYQTYPRGEVVYVYLQDLCISDYNGLPQLCYSNSTSNVKRIPESAVPDVIIASGVSAPVQAAVLSIADFGVDNLNTLIRLTGVQFNSGSANQSFADAANQFSVNHTIEDCNMNEVILRTSGFADFADARTPNGNGSVEAVLQIFGSDYQLFLRDVADVTMTGTRCGSVGTGDGLDEMFEGLTDFSDIALSGWNNIAIEGTRRWYSRNFDNNGFAEVEAYQDTNPETDAWLITPSIDTDETSNFSFRSAMAFYKHEGLTVLVASDFSGDVASANWTELPVTIASESDGNYTWIDSGVVDLSAYGSIVHVAFRYVGNAADDTTKIRIDDVKVE
jgi:hypothetical protein